jgi:hypothetical protein
MMIITETRRGTKFGIYAFVMITKIKLIDIFFIFHVNNFEFVF